MDIPKGLSCERLKQHQMMYKAKTPPWKEAFRIKCIQRMQNSRGRLVDKFRGLDPEDVIDAVMNQDWELDTETKKPGIKIFADEEFSDAELNEFFSTMEEIQKELLEEERILLEEYYAAVRNPEIDATVDWLENEEVICPLCKKSILHQNHSVIFCGCGLRIDTQQDGLTLMHFKKELLEGINSHDRSCDVYPDFSLLQYCDITNLAITCKECSFMYIVI
ncbi:RPA-interacting protein A-like [Uloborus diversus]|uniref:RPA-interacting protein A-like n=1 Tax=Uloborus diversus TaxID=327109 RepID=UPI00240A86B3|nr:RPA-interacting protein A-like [Uloborus diversus]